MMAGSAADWLRSSCATNSLHVVVHGAPLSTTATNTCNRAAAIPRVRALNKSRWRTGKLVRGGDKGIGLAAQRLGIGLLNVQCECLEALHGLIEAAVPARFGTRHVNNGLNRSNPIVKAPSFGFMSPISIISICPNLCIVVTPGLREGAAVRIRIKQGSRSRPLPQIKPPFPGRRLGKI
jgi:hypothetical protein